MAERFALSFSGGKDSVLALHRVLRAGWEPAALLTTWNKNRGRSWFHGIPDGLLRQIAASLGIPLTLAVCGEGEDYNKTYGDALCELRRAGVTSCVFGDIDLQAHRDWCEEHCAEAGMKAILPLWRENRRDLVDEFIGEGFSTIIKTVRLAELDESFLGRTLDARLVNRIAARGADVCGENGEYHTMVYDGPIFHKPVAFHFRGIEKTETHAFLNLE